MGGDEVEEEDGVRKKERTWKVEEEENRDEGKGRHCRLGRRKG